MSALVPGSGQLYAGERRRGVVLLSASLLVGGIAAVVFWNDPKALLKLAFDPQVLLGLLVVNAVLFLFRFLAAVDAYRIAGPGADPEWVSWVVAPIVAVVLVMPHAWFAYYDAVQYDLIRTVFVAPVETTTTTTTVPTTTSPVVTTGSSTTTSTTSTTTTTTTPPTVWEGLERLNILLLGSDAGVGRTGVRTDTMILVSIDTETGDLALVSVPRNMVRVPLPESVGIWSCDCFPQIINELYQYGEDHPDSFPGQATPGANAIKGALSEMVGLPIHFYALVALEGFVGVVDAIGGVTINVAERVYDPRYPTETGGTEVVDIQPGTYEFDGHDALAYARTRYSSDDYSRMGRQRCLIEAVVEQADPFSLLRSFPRLAEIIKATVETDLPLDAIPDLIDLVTIVDADEAVSLRLIPPTYITGRDAEGYNIPDVELIREHAEIATTMPPAAAIELLGIDPLTDACE